MQHCLYPLPWGLMHNIPDAEDNACMAAFRSDVLKQSAACAAYTREEALGQPVFGLFEIPGTSHVRARRNLAWISPEALLAELQHWLYLCSSHVPAQIPFSEKKMSSCLGVTASVERCDI